MRSFVAKNPYPDAAPEARGMNIAGQKWTLLIVRELLEGPVRFVEIQRRVTGVSTEQLRVRLIQMTIDGLITRTRYREVPPRVMYELTPKGSALIGVIEAWREWGSTWVKES